MVDAAHGGSNISFYSTKQRCVRDSHLQIPGQPEEVPQEEVPVQDEQPAIDPEIGKRKRTTAECKGLLVFQSDKVVEKTLESTLQMQVEPVKSEQIKIPKQHASNANNM